MARISLDRQKFKWCDDTVANLEPGMAVTVEVKRRAACRDHLPRFAVAALRAQ